MQQIIGPRGETQKKIESQSGCKLSIRGRGSGRIRQDPNEEYERLHVLLQANNDESLDKGTSLIESLLKGEEKEQYKQSSQYQLQVINNLINQEYCKNCGENGHKEWACPNTAQRADVRCEVCGEISHVTKDCKYKNDIIFRERQKEQSHVDQEFASFLQHVEGSNAEKIIANKNNQIIGANGQQVRNVFITDTIDHNQFLRLTYQEDVQNTGINIIQSTPGMTSGINLNVGKIKQRNQFYI